MKKVNKIIEVGRLKTFSYVEKNKITKVRIQNILFNSSFLIIKQSTAKPQIPGGLSKRMFRNCTGHYLVRMRTSQQMQNSSPVLNRPGQVQYHLITEHCHLSQPAQKGILSDKNHFSSMISFAWICTALP